MSRAKTGVFELLLWGGTCASLALGCAHSSKRSDQTAGEPTSRLEDRWTGVSPAPAAQPGEACEVAPVYFALDSATADESARASILAAVACFTRKGMPAHLVLTGATDPRGSEEYNLALGQRRAAAVQNLLMILGIAPARISVSSVGEEMASGADEAGWQLDRRVVTKHE